MSSLRKQFFNHSESPDKSGTMSLKLSNKAIEDFKRIYTKDYGVTLDDASALKFATEFCNLMNGAYKKIPKDYYDNFVHGKG